MGVDGSQSIRIHGPPEVIDELAKKFLVMETDDKECNDIIHYFLGEKQLKILDRGENYIYCSTHFRNVDIYHYFDKLLEKYPMCWIKVSYSTEIGTCGMWIGRYRQGKKFIQEHEWEELDWQEEAHGTDYSR